ncbi:MAG: PorV/PorQ family protein [Gemmatimonadetes bacterium]|nr:PorV/PorQ family protein [Gemmatimonadota bacterium]
MRHIVTRTLLGVVVLGALAGGPAAAQTGVDNTAIGTTSAEFLLLGAGARGAALGGSFAAVANDVTALYWNPAGVALMPRSQATLSTYRYIADTRYSWVGVAFPISGGERAIGFQGATFGFTDQPVYTIDNPEGDGTTYNVAETYLGVTYSQQFSDRFSAGITGKFISDKLGKTSGSAFAVDFGTNFHAQLGPRPIRASFVIQNLGSTLEHTGSALEAQVSREPPLDQSTIPQDPQQARLRTKDWGLPVVFRVGLAFDVMNSAVSRFTLMSEFTQPNNSNAAANGAIEWSLLNIQRTGFTVHARGGYTYQPDNSLDPDATAAGFATALSSDENLDGLAFGGGIAYSRGNFGISIDYARRDLGILGGTDYFSATISW